MTQDPLIKSYQPSEIETRWRHFWVDSKLTHADRNSCKPPFSIVIPPPNVTGKLHMGHALVQTVQDILARYKRMKGFEVMWVPGTDHAGIATQTVVERHLMKQQGLRRAQMQRDEFVEYCWQWKKEYEASILEQIKQLGCSCDWSMLAFTMDATRSKAVRYAFKKLFDKGLIYRGDYLINWDPVLQTALADDEVEYEERQGFLWHINYRLKDGQNLVVATTRPETLLGDVAIAVHPNDTRYQAYIGQTVTLPLIGREIPIIADGFVDPEFGSGVVKITPGHDPNDYQMALRHQLSMINLLNLTGTLNENASSYQGYTMLQAREKIISDLKDQGLLVDAVAHTHRVGVSYRSKAVIEPMLSKQWFVRLSAFKGLLREAVETGRVELIPSGWQNTYFHWIDHLHDWCISRQLWWGHRIPVWYRRDNPQEILCHDGEELPEEVKNNPQEWIQEEDVLDTWFSSALWPLSCMGWPDQTLELERFYPTSILVTGHDILFFWVARMMLMGELMSGKMPFSKVYLHGLIFAKSYWRDQKEGGIAYVSAKEQEAFDLGAPLGKDVHSRWEKMSKSKGNILDPLEMIQKYGTDAVRLSLCSSLGDSRQIDLDRRKFEEYKNFSNKIFNGARFILMNLDQEPALKPSDLSQGLDDQLFLTEDLWILEKLNQTLVKVTHSIDTFEFAHAASAAYDFFWNEFCSYYLEISKPVLWSKAASDSHRVNKQKLLTVLLAASLRLLHPFTPFITEELFEKLKLRFQHAQAHESLDPWSRELIEALKAPCCMSTTFPNVYPLQDGPRAKDLDWLIKIVYQLRLLRSEMKVPTGCALPLYLEGTLEELEKIKNHEYVLQALVPIQSFHYQELVPAQYFCAKSQLGSLLLALPLPQEMAQAESLRLQKLRAQIELNINGLKTRLENPDFINRAPLELVEKQKALFADLQNQLKQVDDRLSHL